MTGNQIVNALRKHRGEVCVAAQFANDAPYIRVYKSDVIAHFKDVGDVETECSVRVSDGTAYVDHY